MADMMYSGYFSAKLAVQHDADKGGYGVYAVTAIPAGELLIIWGGDIVTGEQLHQLPAYQQNHGIQIEENIYQVPTVENDPADLVNHSCDPNAGLNGQIALVAMRPIAAGEEVTFDYAMSDGSPYDEFVCSCGGPTCRGQITGEDWRRPELQKRYAGYFSPYLQRRIDQLTRERPTSDNGRYSHPTTQSTKTKSS